MATSHARPTRLQLVTLCGSTFYDGDPIHGSGIVLVPGNRTDSFDVLAIASGGALPVPQFIAATGFTYASDPVVIPGSFAPMQAFPIHMTNVRSRALPNRRPEPRARTERRTSRDRGVASDGAPIFAPSWVWQPPCEAPSSLRRRPLLRPISPSRLVARRWRRGSSRR